MGPDVLTISKLARHESIGTTRRRYDYFNTERILGEMAAALEDRDIPLGTFPRRESTALLLPSPPPVVTQDETKTEKPDSD
jgi:hypothetical protein